MIKINIEEAVRKLAFEADKAQQKLPTMFWEQCVRDVSGKWRNYYGHSSRYGVKYFRRQQSAVDYNNPEEVSYLQSSINTRRKFYSGLLGIGAMDVTAFCQWLEQLRRAIAYRPTNEWLHQRFATTAHSEVVQAEVLPIAQKYNDPYARGEARGPTFPHFPKSALPYDIVETGKIDHHYPTLNYSDLYLSAALETLKKLLSTDLDKEAYIFAVAYFYQLLINLHYFAAMNASLYMNMANGLLEIAGVKGIENGIIDFVALRLQPDNFEKFFYDEVMA